MKNTPETYDPFPTIRSPEVILTFQVMSTGFTKNQVVVSSGTAAKLGAVKNIVNGVTRLKRKYATLERNGWPLDGSCYIMPSSGEVGFWPNAVTAEGGGFSSPVTVSCVLPVPVHTLGWTFHFDDKTGVFAPVVRAVCYDVENAQIDDYTGEVIDDTANGNGWRLTHSVTGYSRVDFYFPGLNEGYRYLRLIEIDFGVSRSFNRDTVGDLRIIYEADPSGDTLPAKKLSFTFDNSDKEFNVLNPIDVYQYWRNGQAVTAAVRIGDDDVNMGTFFVSRAEIGENYLTARVTAYDEVNQLGTQTFYPGNLAELSSVTLKTAVEKVLAGYTLGVNYGGLENEPVSLAIRSTHEKRAVLHYIAQAARATCWIDTEGVVQFRRLEVASTRDGRLTGNELYDWSGVSIAEEVTGCSLSVERELEEEPTTETYVSGTPSDEGSASVYYSNPCVAPGQGQAVCDWLLSVANMAKRYEVKNRCDPAVEIGDTLQIYDVFGNNDRAVVTGIDISYNGALSCVTKAVAEFA
jgi:hypothetical protein